jgi:Zn-dependent alcohol dehydrogenase
MKSCLLKLLPRASAIRTSFLEADYQDGISSIQRFLAMKVTHPLPRSVSRMLTRDAGAGYVKQVGSKVTIAEPGDPVLLSFDSCGECHFCKTGHPSYCSQFDINFSGEKTFRSATVAQDAEPDIAGSFFGQSSFSNLTIAKPRSVVNVKGMVQHDDELKLFAPLGCGYQTGSGAIVNIANAGTSDEVLILGCGGVGLSALMASASDTLISKQSHADHQQAAKMRGCKSIVAIDLVDSRLELARTLGATQTINTTGMSEDEIEVAVKNATSGLGPTITFDTVGKKQLLIKAIGFTRNRGKIISVATTGPDMTVDIRAFDFMTGGKQYIGAVEGDAEPRNYVPEMIKWYRDGKFPIDKLGKLFKAEDFKRALDEMHGGAAIKPIITW